MGKRSKLVRIDPSLEEIYEKFKKEGKVNNFPEFSRMIANDAKTKKKDLRFFK